MCFSAEASFAAAAILLPAGAIGVQRAYRTDPRYLPFAALPIFFGLQQLLEGLVWTGNALSSDTMVQRFSLAYMFFSWLAWPVWVPLSTYFLEPCGRRYVYLIFAIMGGMLGAMQYLPYFAHEGWLVTKLFPHASRTYERVIFLRDRRAAPDIFEPARSDFWHTNFSSRDRYVSIFPVRIHIGILLRRGSDVALHCLRGVSDCDARARTGGLA